MAVIRKFLDRAALKTKYWMPAVARGLVRDYRQHGLISSAWIEITVCICHHWQYSGTGLPADHFELRALPGRYRNLHFPTRKALDEFHRIQAERTNDVLYAQPGASGIASFLLATVNWGAPRPSTAIRRSPLGEYVKLRRAIFGIKQPPGSFRPSLCFPFDVANPS
jgi:hypothetical protein